MTKQANGAYVLCGGMGLIVDGLQMTHAAFPFHPPDTHSHRHQERAAAAAGGHQRGAQEAAGRDKAHSGPAAALNEWWAQIADVVPQGGERGGVWHTEGWRLDSDGMGIDGRGMWDE